MGKSERTSEFDEDTWGNVIENGVDWDHQLCCLEHRRAAEQKTFKRPKTTRAILDRGLRGTAPATPQLFREDAAIRTAIDVRSFSSLWSALMSTLFSHLLSVILFIIIWLI